MMNRELIKSQAKQIIKGHIWALFFIVFIVGILTGTNSVYNFAKDADDTYGIVTGEDGNKFGDYSENSDGDNGDFYSYFDDDSDDYYDGFTGAIKPIKSITSSIAPTFGISFGLLSLVFMPLSVTLMGYFVLVIRGRKIDFGDGISNVFSTAFSENYFKYFVLNLVKNLIVAICCVFLIVPGIIMYYRYYFAEQILCENPKMKPSDALKLSAKMTNGAKGDLFMLDLSFIGWFLLTAITCGLVGIYVAPYYLTTRALYYQNYKVKLLQEGRITDDDFLSAEEKNMKYQTYYNANGYNPYAPNGNDYSNQNYNANYAQNSYANPYEPNSQPFANQTTYYQPPFNEQQNANPQNVNPYQNSYTDQGNTNADNSPVSDAQFTEATYSAPAEPEFTEPVEPKEDFVEPDEPKDM